MRDESKTGVIIIAFFLTGIAFAMFFGAVYEQEIYIEKFVNTESSRDFFINTASGNEPHVTSITMWGSCDSIDTTKKMIWCGDVDYTHLVTPSLIHFASDDPDDTVSGTGARVIRIGGLNLNYTWQYEDVNMNGLSNVTTTLEYIRVYQAEVIQSGSSQTNEGLIYGGDVLTESLQVWVNPNRGRTTWAGWTVPAGYTGFMVNTGTQTTMQKTQGTMTYWLEYRLYRVANQTWVTYGEIWLLDDTFNFGYPTVLSMPEKTDVRISAQTSAGDADSSGWLTFIMVENSYIEAQNNVVTQIQFLIIIVFVVIGAIVGFKAVR